MQYKGKELIELSPENWDGKSREMIVWTNAINPSFKDVCHIKTVIGYNPRKLAWVVDDKGLAYWPHCAAIPEESDQEKDINEMIKVLKAHKEGRKIEYRIKDENVCHPWTYSENPPWDWSTYEYRVERKPRLMTYREVNEWLAKGNGRYKITGETPLLKYDEDETVDSELVIHGWGEPDWHRPIIED